MAAMRSQQAQQIMQQQAQQRAMMAQQLQQSGMQVGANGMPMPMQLGAITNAQLANLNPQQIASLRQAGRLNPVSSSAYVCIIWPQG